MIFPWSWRALTPAPECLLIWQCRCHCMCAALAQQISFCKKKKSSRAKQSFAESAHQSGINLIFCSEAHPVSLNLYKMQQPQKKKKLCIYTFYSWFFLTEPAVGNLWQASWWRRKKGKRNVEIYFFWSYRLQRYLGRTIFTPPFLCAQSFRPITSGYGSRKSSYTPEPQLPAPPQPPHLNNGHPKPNSGHSYGYGNGTGHSQYNNPAGLYAHNGSNGDRSLPSKMGNLSISATHRWGLAVWQRWAKYGSGATCGPMS